MATFEKLQGVRTQNLTVAQDKILKQCEDFGGVAAEAAEMVAELDEKLSIALIEIESLKSNKT